MLKCNDASKLSSEQLDRNLNIGECLQLRIHLLLCKACRQYSEQLHFLSHSGLHNKGSDSTIEGMNEATKSRLKARLKKCVKNL